MVKWSDPTKERFPDVQTCDVPSLRQGGLGRLWPARRPGHGWGAHGEPLRLSAAGARRAAEEALRPLTEHPRVGGVPAGMREIEIGCVSGVVIPSGRLGRTACMPACIRSYSDEEDITFLRDVGDDGWVSRSIELVAPSAASKPRPPWTRCLGHARLEALRPCAHTKGATACCQNGRQASGRRASHMTSSVSDFDRVWAESRRALQP